MDGLLPAAMLRADPPSQVGGGSSVVTGITFILGIVPLCSCVRVQLMQRVAFASSVPSTAWTSWSGGLHTITGPCRPAVLLSCWAVKAEPEDLLVTFQSSIVGKILLKCIAFMVPFCQESSAWRVLAVCKGWVLSLDLRSCTCTIGAPSLAPVIRSRTPLVAAGITQPANRLISLRHHAVRGTIIGFKVPLSCNQGSLGSQTVVLAHLASTALRAPTTPGPGYCRLPAVQVTVWALITNPPDLCSAMWFDVNVA